MSGVFSWFYCWHRGIHEPVRQPMGGFVCALCGHAGESLNEMGFPGDGYVAPVRKVYVREDGGPTRTSAWEPGPRGW